MSDYSGSEEPSDVQKIIKHIAIQASRGGGNVNQIINQIWTQWLGIGWIMLQQYI
jgi:hypothetical protein